MNAFDAAEKNGQDGELQSALGVLLNSHNQAENQSSSRIPATYLRVTVEV